MFCRQVFQKMRIPQIRDPQMQLDRLPDSYRARIALIGCGPASISCATYLARLGYNDVTIFEKRDYIGGLRFSFQGISHPRRPLPLTDDIALPLSRIKQSSGTNKFMLAQYCVYLFCL